MVRNLISHTEGRTYVIREKNVLESILSPKKEEEEEVRERQRKVHNEEFHNFLSSNQGAWEGRSM
jgi:hypothetical protein